MNHKNSNNKTDEIKKHEKAVSKILWKVAGLLFLLPGFFGGINAGFILIGVMFMIFGFTADRLNDSSTGDQ